MVRNANKARSQINIRLSDKLDWSLRQAADRLEMNVTTYVTQLIRQSIPTDISMAAERKFAADRRGEEALEELIPGTWPAVVPARRGL